MLTYNSVPEREDALADINEIFEKSDRAGQVLWDPKVAVGEPAPDAVMFIKETIRLAIVIMTGPCSVENGRWKCNDSTGGVLVENPLERAWRAATAVRNKLKDAIGVGMYVIPVVIFPHTEERPDIIAACQRRKVRLVWGMDDDLVETLAGLPEPDEIQHQLSDEFIADEIAVLQKGDQLSGTAPKPKPEIPTEPDTGKAMDLSDRAVIMHHVDQVVINIQLPG